MTAILSKLMIAVNPAILAIVIAYSYGLISRKAGNKYAGQFAMGIVMGAAAIFAMMSPIHFAEGVIVDMRSLVIGLAGAFFGLIGAAIAATMAIITRLTIGGMGVYAGVTGILLSAGLGLAWSIWVRPRIKFELTAHVALGVMISGHLLSAMLLPADVIMSFMVSLAPWLVVLNIVGALVIGTLIAHEKRIEDRTTALMSAATTDPLTKLLNRRSLVEMFENLSKPTSSDDGTAMLCFDIDHFKRINDTNGHMLGDQVLLEIKDRISSCLRPSDLFSRIGGDEFLIVLPNVNRSETTVIAERCRQVIAQNPVNFEETDVKVTISMGANWIEGTPDFTESLAETDAILYKAKASGRNCVAYGFKTTINVGPSSFYRSGRA